VLVDTPYQLATPHSFLGKTMLVADFVREKLPNLDARVMDSVAFARSAIGAHVVFSINVLDVVPRHTRSQMVAACIANMRDDGVFVAVVPRNDTWTLRICTPHARYQDGYIFPHARGYTYYHNWTGNTLSVWLARQGLAVVKDLSIYRHACLICKKMPNRVARD
jgi:hypothetical protein